MKSLVSVRVPFMNLEIVICREIEWVGFGREEVPGGTIIWLGYYTLVTGPKGA